MQETDNARRELERRPTDDGEETPSVWGVLQAYDDVEIDPGDWYDPETVFDAWSEGWMSPDTGQFEIGGLGSDTFLGMPDSVDDAFKFWLGTHDGAAWVVEVFGSFTEVFGGDPPVAGDHVAVANVIQYAADYAFGNPLYDRTHFQPAELVVVEAFNHGVSVLAIREHHKLVGNSEATFQYVSGRYGNFASVPLELDFYELGVAKIGTGWPPGYFEGPDI